MTTFETTTFEGAKTFVRAAFRKSALDVTTDYETVLGFVRLFKGEPEAKMAIDQCAFLSPEERRVLERYIRCTR